MMKAKFSALLFAATVAVAASAFGGALDSSKEAPEPAPACATPPDVEFRVGIPGWIAGLSGDFGVRGVVTDQDVKFTDILKRLDMLAVGSLYARYHRWEISADGLLC
jgi:hypothetical protein